MTAPVRLSVMEAGLIGKRHIEHILARPEAQNDNSGLVTPTSFGTGHIKLSFVRHAS